MRWTNRSKPRSLVIARLMCQRVAGCANQVGGQKAYFEVSDLELQARDVSPPQVQAAGLLQQLGETWQWHRGEVNFLVNSTDTGAGVAESFLKVNGLKLDLEEVSCPGDHSTYATSFSPCPPQVGRFGVADSAQAPFQEGVNTFQFCASDYSGTASESNQTCTPARFAFIDNVAPAAPERVETVGGSGWRATNGFEVTWENPGGQRSPVAAAEFRLIDATNGSVVDTGTVETNEPAILGPIDMPAPGEYRVELKLRDSAGNLGPAASTIVRYDDGRPGEAAPEPPGGWISADEFPLDQEIGRADAGGPSGVSGYALTVSGTGPVSPCPTGECLPSELSLDSGADVRVTTIERLPEGNHWITSVAASGARLASETLGVTLARVDKTEPVTTLAGVPTGWVREPVTITAAATDELSGMVAKPETDNGYPVTVIRAGDNPPYVAPGPLASFTVADEGITRIDYWARDLAGNVNDGALTGDGDVHERPGEATIRIDRSKPVVTIEANRDPSDPELITARVKDTHSGLDTGSFWYRQAGQGHPFTEMETSVEGSTLIGRIPSDSLAAGTYEIQAEALDRAGNRGTSSDGSSPLKINIPLKQSTRLSARLVKKKQTGRKIQVRGGKRARVTGSLTGPGGEGIPGAPVLVDQQFAAGSRTSNRIIRVRTDGAGRYLAKLPAGPSRTIEVRSGGSRIHQPAVSEEIRLVSKDRVSFRVNPGVLKNGSRTRMSGKVQGKGALNPARGKLVAIQYFDPGRTRWRPVEVLRANRRGRFSYAYRFRTISSAQKILFRAVSLPERGWPFKPSTSGRRSVIVYPSD
ncbi:MAG: carboxypeptidase-like regulatory domain-containing protein [Solirubrobacterales bacterium]